LTGTGDAAMEAKEKEQSSIVVGIIRNRGKKKLQI
jgi:hypothetical protein